MNKPPGASLLGALVRVTRFERAISTSQMWRGTSSATPGYSVLSYYTTPRAKIKDFPVCGQSCGQSRFSVRFRDPAKSHKRPCCKAFRASASQVVDGVRTTPKAGALPTALHPVIQLFYPAGRILPNQTRYHLRYIRIYLSYFTDFKRKVKGIVANRHKAPTKCRPELWPFSCRSTALHPLNF